MTDFKKYTSDGIREKALFLQEFVRKDPEGWIERFALYHVFAERNYLPKNFFPMKSIENKVSLGERKIFKEILEEEFDLSAKYQATCKMCQEMNGNRNQAYVFFGITFAEEKQIPGEVFHHYRSPEVDKSPITFHNIDIIEKLKYPILPSFSRNFKVAPVRLAENVQKPPVRPPPSPLITTSKLPLVPPAQAQSPTLSIPAPLSNTNSTAPSQNETICWVDQKTLSECEQAFQTFVAYDRIERKSIQEARRRTVALMREKFKCSCPSKSIENHAHRRICNTCFGEFNGDYTSIPFVICDNCINRHEKYCHESSYIPNDNE